jgi:membrane-associated phospholipid phosphatase
MSRQEENCKINLKIRAIWLAIMLAVMLLYFPINRLAGGGAALESAIDPRIPLYPLFILPYLTGLILFGGLLLWAAFKANKGEFESYYLCLLFTTLISYVIYIVLPTYVNRPTVNGADFFSQAITWLYQTDRAYNAAPSGHTYYTVISAIYLTSWKPSGIWLWFGLTILILASTLFTRQHNLLDLVTGLALAVAVYLAVSYWQRRKPFTFAS